MSAELKSFTNPDTGTTYIQYEDPYTGFEFIHTAHGELPDTTQEGAFSTIEDPMYRVHDQITNAARCTLEAGWLKTYLKFNIAETDREVEEVLLCATERMNGTRPHEYLRTIKPAYVELYIASLEARAEELRALANNQTT